MDNIWKSKSTSASTKPKLMETAVFSAVLYIYMWNKDLHKNSPRKAVSIWNVLLQKDTVG